MNVRRSAQARYRSFAASGLLLPSQCRPTTTVLAAFRLAHRFLLLFSPCFEGSSCCVSASEQLSCLSSFRAFVKMVWRLNACTSVVMLRHPSPSPPLCAMWWRCSAIYYDIRSPACFADNLLTVRVETRRAPLRKFANFVSKCNRSHLSATSS